MAKNEHIRFTTSSIKLPNHDLNRHPNTHLPFCSQTLTSQFNNTKNSIINLITSFQNRSKPSSLSCSWPSNTNPGPILGGKSVSSGEARVLLSEVLVRNKDGEELERKDLEAEAITALKACRPWYAPTVNEVQEDVHRIVDSGYFSSCIPVAVDTRGGHGNGIRLVFQVEPNQEFKGLVCEGANVLPLKFVEDAFRVGLGHEKVVNTRRLDEAIRSINGWYKKRGLVGSVSNVEMLSGGIARLQVSEAEVNDISLRFLDKKGGEPTTGKTRPETILRELTTKKGQVYSLLGRNRDEAAVRRMGIMEDVSIVPQPVEDSTGKVDLTINVVEHADGVWRDGFSGGISSTGGLIRKFGFSHSNVLGRNKKLNLSLEKSRSDSMYRIKYTDPWIEGDDKRTSRSIMVQNSKTPGTFVHGNQPYNNNLTIGRATAGVQLSRQLTPNWSGTTGLSFQRAGAHDDHGNPILNDFHGCPLTASGNAHDYSLRTKLGSVYTSSDGSSMFATSIEQGLPVYPDWLFFSRLNARARKSVQIGPARLSLSMSGGHVVGNFSPHEASAIGVVFSDYGTDLGSGHSVPGDPAGARLKPGSGYGCGFGIHVNTPCGPFRFEYAFNDKLDKRFHFGFGHRN